MLGHLKPDEDYRCVITGLPLPDAVLEQQEAEDDFDRAREDRIRDHFEREGVCVEQVDENTIRRYRETSR